MALCHCQLPEGLLAADAGDGQTCTRESGVPIRREVPEKIFFGRAPKRFNSKSTISRFRERSRDGQYSLVIFFLLFFYSRSPPCPAICKNGGTCPVPHGVGATDHISKQWILIQCNIHNTRSNTPLWHSN